MTKSEDIFFKLINELSDLKRNKKTGFKKNENGNRRCFTVLLSNHDM